MMMKKPRIYFKNDLLVVRSLLESDIPEIIAKERAQGWHPDEQKYLLRLSDEKNDMCYTMVALYQHKVAGYINLYYPRDWSPFSPEAYPEIVDLGVFSEFRRLGIGNQLMDVAESLAKTFSDKVYLGVGLHQGYGSAQRLYIKRGYLPDGKGVYYHHMCVDPYQTYPIDDDLLIYMSKELK